jgi:hypothetical protein
MGLPAEKITGLAVGSIIATIVTAHRRKTRTRSQAVQRSMAGQDDHIHSDIRKPHSPIHVDQVGPRPSRNSSQTKRNERAVAPEHCY